MKTSTVMKLSGLLGASLIVFGGIMLYRDRKRQGLGNYRQVSGRFAEAPMLDRYHDDESNAVTTLRGAENLTIEQRIGSIQKMIEKSVMDPEMTRLAMKITEHCPERDGKCEAKAIYKWVKQHVRYTGDVAPIKMSNGDVEGIDRYATARRTIEYGSGDCDDQVTVVATLTSSIGLLSKLRVTAECPDPAQCEDGHIYPVVALPKFSDSPTNFVALDTTLPGSYNFGVEAPSARITDYDA